VPLLEVLYVHVSDFSDEAAEALARIGKSFGLTIPKSQGEGYVAQTWRCVVSFSKIQRSGEIARREEIST
jgi:hypothetical protein